MLVDVVMPKMGESITEGTILEWRKKVGDTIAADEILLEIGTDKVDSEIPSPNAGVIAKILAEPNDVVEVGKVIVRIETDGDVAAAPIPEPEKEPKQKPEPVQATEQPSPVTTSEPPPNKSIPQTGEKKYYTPLVKSIARKEGISQDELVAIQGTGKNGRVTKKDLLGYIETRTAVPTAPPVPAVVSQLTDEIGRAHV